MGDAADKSQQKLEGKYKDIDQITSKSNKKIKAMYAEAEKNIQLKHEKAEKEINKRWENEKFIDGTNSEKKYIEQIMRL